MNLLGYITVGIASIISFSSVAQVKPVAADTSQHMAAIKDTSKHIAGVKDSLRPAPIIVIAPTPPAPDSNIKVDAPETVRSIVQKLYDYQRYTHCTSPGYRVQIDFSQDRSAANNTKSNFSGKYPGMSSYITYKQPYFRVSVGDFRGRLEAFRFLSTVKKDYPGAFIVSEKITLPPIQ
jgi:hypothetical protein